MPLTTRSEAIKILVSKGIIKNPFLVEEIEGGIVHDIVYIKDKKRDSYLKTRLDHFKTDSSIKIGALDMVHEYKALLLVRRACGPIVPRVFFFKDNFILLENIKKPNDKNLYDLIRAQKITEEDIFKIAESIKTIHIDLRNEKMIRSPRDEKAQYDNYLYWRFGIWKNKSLAALMDNLKTNGSKQLILGDLNPKNIVMGKTIKYFDLETLHLGDKEFDIGFFLGHLLLSYFNNLSAGKKLIKKFRENYNFDDSQEKLIVNICLGTIFYRMKTNFSYEVSFQINKKEMTDKISRLLEKNISSFENLFASI